MRTATALLLMAATVAHAATSSTKVQSDLFYVTPTHCTELSGLPTHQDLSGDLVQNERFLGTVTLTTSASSSNGGCLLHFQVNGDIEHAAGGTHDDVFALTGEIDDSLPTLLDAKVLRTASINLSKQLTLQRIQVKIDQNRNYAIDTRVTSLDDTAAAEVTLDGRNCGGLASKELVDDLFPGISDVSVIADATKEVGCAVGLNIAGRAPVLRSTDDMLGLLKSVDDTLNEWFGSSASKQSHSQLTNARVAFSAPGSAAVSAAKHSSDTAGMNLAARERFNAPTKQITLGILMGITVLCAILFAVVYQKKRHEHNQQTRHNNASRVAQLHRVSYRMGYQRVDANDPLRATEEEEKQDLL